jgi:hypothetical protein
MNTTFSVALRAAALSMMLAMPASAQSFGSSTTDNAVGFGRDPGVAFGAVAQTFTTPVSSPVLQSFTFFLGDYLGGADLRFRADVFAFSGDRIVGPSLYASSVRHGSDNQSGYSPYLFADVNVLLTGGSTYVLLLRPTDLSPDGSSNFVATSQSNSFTLGSLFYASATSDAALALAGAFTQSTDADYGVDAAVIATFGPVVTTVPEPSTVALLASGLAVIGMLARRRTRRRD